MMKRFLITGVDGFIESAVVRFLIDKTIHQVLNLDKVAHPGDLESLAGIAKQERGTSL